MEKGADVNATDPYGWTALMNAVYLGDAEMVQLLLNAGTDVNHKNYLGRTALFISEKTGKPEIMRMLKEAGAVE